jgi:hypothetical protein
MSVICKEVDHLSRREGATATSLAAKIERAINKSAGRRICRCDPPMTFRPGDLPSTEDDLRYGLELSLGTSLESPHEPFGTVADFGDRPMLAIAGKLRERAAVLNRAADALSCCEHTGDAT